MSKCDYRGALAECHSLHCPVHGIPRLEFWEKMIGTLWIEGYWDFGGTDGGVYEIYDITNQDSENPAYPVTISYRGRNGRRWSKTWARFKETMRPAGVAREAETPPISDLQAQVNSNEETIAGLLVLGLKRDERLDAPEKALARVRRSDE